jgi:hypothetical protein
MKVLRRSVLVAAALAAALTLSACSSDSDTASDSMTEETTVGTIVDVAAGDGSFSTLVAAVTAADATLTLLPASVVSFPSPDVTIAKGKRISNTFAIKINTSTLDPKKAYGLAFTITTISKTGVATSSNLSTVVYKIALKNKYDGFYEVTGTMVDYVAPALTGFYPHTVNLYTAGPDAVDYGQTQLNFGASYPRGEIHLIMNFRK